jgi:hypothetical protein
MNDPPSVRFIAPLQAAWRRMVRILFQPFDMGKWFALGFTAWLAQLGESGGSLNMNVDPDSESGQRAIGFIAGFIRDHLAVAVTFGAVVFLVFALLGLILLWLRSRGKFMFLENALLNRALIRDPWNRYRDLGNSLFLWTVGFIFASLILIAAVAALGYALAQPFTAPGHRAAYLALVIVGILVFLVIILALCFTISLLESFVIPLMARYQEPTSAAWRRFGALFRQSPWSFVLYLLFEGVLVIGLLAAIIVFGFLTCCCGFVILIIPYVGTVLLLPVFVTFRLFSVEFLRQFGPAYDLDYSGPPPVPSADAA